jgi:photosystem II stability/assembly factor-like uncharacterized protein
MAIFGNRDKEILSDAGNLVRKKVTVLGADGYSYSEPYPREQAFPLSKILRFTPDGNNDGYGLVTPNYDDYPVEGTIGTRQIQVRLHSYIPSGLSGPSSCQAFFAISSAPSSNSIDDLDSVRIKPLIDPAYSHGRTNAANTDPSIRGFELALYPAKDNLGVLEADTSNGPISPVADPSAPASDDTGAGANSDGFWYVDYESGVVRFSKPPLNGSTGVMNPNNVFGDIDGNTDANGAITMFATFYEYTGEFGIQDDPDLVTVGDGYVSTGQFSGQSYNILQSAIDFLPYEGGTVFIKEGNYNFTSSAVIPENVTLKGLNGVTISAPENAAALKITGDGITIDGLKIDASESENSYCIEFSNNLSGEVLKDATIKNNIFASTNDAYGILFSPESETTYKNVVFRNNLFEEPRQAPWIADGYEETIIRSNDGYTWETVETGRPGEGRVWTEVMPNTTSPRENTSLYATSYNGSSGKWVQVGKDNPSPAFIDSPFIMTSTDGYAWTESSETLNRSLGTNYELVSVANNGALEWVAVGTDTTLVYSDDDTATWTVGDLKLTWPGDSTDIAHDGSGLYVVVGEGGAIATGPDATTWTLRTPDGGYSDDFRSVAHDGSGLWTIVGDSGEIQTSPDGTTWTSRTSGTSNNLTAVAHDGAGVWVAVGASGTARRSTDGITWNTITDLSSGSESFKCVAYGKDRNGAGLWMAASSLTIWISGDGLNWSKINHSNTADEITDYYVCSGVKPIAHNGNTLWVLGSSGRTHTSSDGYEFSRRTGASRGGLGLAHDGSGLFCSVGNKGFIITSQDGITWIRRYSGTTTRLWDVYNNGNNLWVAVGDSGLILSSPDGITWTQRTPDSGWSGSFYSVIYGNGTWMIGGSSEEIQTSPDGITWTRVRTGGSSTVPSLAFDGTSRWVWSNISTDQAMVSDDNGVTWTPKDYPPTPSGNYSYIEYDPVDDMWVIVGSAGIIYSTDEAETWTQATICDVRIPERVRKFNGVWYTIDYNGSIYASDNGIDWFRQTVLSDILFGMAGFGDLMAVIGNTEGPYTASTSATSSGPNLHGIKINAGKAIAVGDGGTVLLSSMGARGTRWVDRSHSHNGIGDELGILVDVNYSSFLGKWIVCGENGAIITSTDIYSWTEETSGVTTVLRSILSGSDFLVIVGNEGTAITSYDGSSWTPQDSKVVEHLNGITSDDSFMIAVGDDGAVTLAPNTDITTWSAKSSGTSENLYDVHSIMIDASNSLTVAVGANGTIITSTDSGFTWSSQSLVVSEDLISVHHDGTLWTVVGDDGTVIVSSNGISWVEQTSTTTKNLRHISSGSTDDLQSLAIGSVRTNIAGFENLTIDFNTIFGNSEIALGSDLMSDLIITDNTMEDTDVTIHTALSYGSICNNTVNNFDVLDNALGIRLYNNRIIESFDFRGLLSASTISGNKLTGTDLTTSYLNGVTDVIISGNSLTNDLRIEGSATTLSFNNNHLDNSLAITGSLNTAKITENIINTLTVSDTQYMQMLGNQIVSLTAGYFDTCQIDGNLVSSLFQFEYMEESTISGNYINQLKSDSSYNGTAVSESVISDNSIDGYILVQNDSSSTTMYRSIISNNAVIGDVSIDNANGNGHVTDACVISGNHIVDELEIGGSRTSTDSGYVLYDTVIDGNKIYDLGIANLGRDIDTTTNVRGIISNNDITQRTNISGKSFDCVINGNIAQNLDIDAFEDSIFSGNIIRSLDTIFHGQVISSSITGNYSQSDLTMEQGIFETIVSDNTIDVDFYIQNSNSGVTGADNSIISDNNIDGTFVVTAQADAYGAVQTVISGNRVYLDAVIGDNVTGTDTSIASTEQVIISDNIVNGTLQLGNVSRDSGATTHIKSIITDNSVDGYINAYGRMLRSSIVDNVTELTINTGYVDNSSISDNNVGGSITTGVLIDALITDNITQTASPSLTVSAPTRGSSYAINNSIIKSNVFAGDVSIDEDYTTAEKTIIGSNISDNMVGGDLAFGSPLNATGTGSYVDSCTISSNNINKSMLFRSTGSIANSTISNNITGYGISAPGSVSGTTLIGNSTAYDYSGFNWDLDYMYTISAGNGQLIILCDGSWLISNDGGDTWVKYTGVVAGASYGGGLAYGNGVWVSAPTGSEGELFWQTSADGGVTWSGWAQYDISPDPTIYDIIYASALSLFVGVGTDGTVITSANPANNSSWTKRTSNTSEDLYSVAYDTSTGLLVAVGDDEAIITSTNGITWTDRSALSPLGSSARLYCVATNEDGSWCAVGYNTSSTDAALITTGSPTTYWDDRSSAIDPAIVTNDRLLSVNYGGNEWVIHGDNTASGPILISTDNAYGYTGWTTKDGYACPDENNIRANSMTFDGTYFWSIGTVNRRLSIRRKRGGTVTPDAYWTNAGPKIGAWDIEGIAANDSGTVVVVCEYNEVMVSTDYGDTWSSTSDMVNTRNKGFTDIAYGDGVFVAVGPNIYTSTSPESTWILRTNPTGETLQRVIYNNGRFIAVGDSGSIIRSDDGVSWINESGGSASFVDVAGEYESGGSGNNLMAVASDGYTCTSTDNGNNWSHVGDTSGTTFSVGYDSINDTWFALGTSGTVYKSIDFGVTWASGNDTGAYSGKKLIGNQGIMYASDGFYFYWSISDSSWSSMGPGGSNGTVAFCKNSRYIFMIDETNRFGRSALLSNVTASNMWLTSSIGSDTPLIPSGSSKEFGSSTALWTGNFDQVNIITPSETIDVGNTITEDGLITQRINVAAATNFSWPHDTGATVQILAVATKPLEDDWKDNTDDNIVCVGNTANCWSARSPISNSWTNTAMGGSANANNVRYSPTDDRWVAVGDSGNIWHSTDPDLSWTNQTAGANHFNDIMHSSQDGGSMWVAVGNNSSVYYNTAPFSGAWTLANTGLGGGVDWDRVAYHNGRWVIYGIDTTPCYVATTTDPASGWTQTSLGTLNTAYQISYIEPYEKWFIQTYRAGATDQTIFYTSTDPGSGSWTETLGPEDVRYLGSDTTPDGLTLLVAATAEGYCSAGYGAPPDIGTSSPIATNMINPFGAIYSIPGKLVEYWNGANRFVVILGDAYIAVSNKII